MDSDMLVGARIQKHNLVRVQSRRRDELKKCLTQLQIEFGALSDLCFEAGSTAAAAASHVAHTAKAPGTLDQPKLWELLGAAGAAQQDVAAAEAVLGRLQSGVRELSEHYRALDRIGTELARAHKQVRAHTKAVPGDGKAAAIKKEPVA